MKKLHGAVSIKRMDPQRLERVKISFLFSFLVLISLLCGILIANHISIDFYAKSLFRVSTHFEAAFLKCSDIIGGVRVIAMSSASDIVSVLIVFAASFSTLNYLVTDVVLLYSGVRLGVAVTFLANLSQKTDFAYSIGNSRFFAFALTELLMLALLLYYSCQAARASLWLRSIDSNGRPNIEAKDLLVFALKTAACIGLIFILNAIYCFLLYILK